MLTRLRPRTALSSIPMHHSLTDITDITSDISTNRLSTRMIIPPDASRSFITCRIQAQADKRTSAQANKHTSTQVHKQTNTQVHKHTRIEITKGTMKLPSRYDDNALYDSHRSAPSYHLEWNSTCTSTDLHDREMDIVRLIGSISGWECAKREHHTEKPCHPIKNWHHQKYNTSSKI